MTYGLANAVALLSRRSVAFDATRRESWPLRHRRAASIFLPAKETTGNFLTRLIYSLSVLITGVWQSWTPIICRYGA